MSDTTDVQRPQLPDEVRSLTGISGIRPGGQSQGSSNSGQGQNQQSSNGGGRTRE
jgi:hypothetical protein